MLQMRAAERRIPLVVGIAGLLGTGKTTVAQYLVSNYRFGYVRYSQVLADWFNEGPGSKAELQAVGWEVMSTGLQAELNRRLISRIDPETDCTVDGLRHPLDYESLKNAFASAFKFIYIDSPQEERWLRQHKRSRFATFAEFCVADSHPVEQQIRLLESHADFCICNDGSVEQLHDKITNLIGSLGKESK